MAQVPQLNEETGITADYMNVYSGAVSYYEWMGLVKAAESLAKYPVPHYEERYASYEGLVTSKNQSSISELDSIADAVNSAVENGTLSSKIFVDSVRRVEEIIYGKNTTLKLARLEIKE